MAKDSKPPITATYLWCDKKPFPDGIILKDSSALAPDGKSARLESYGRNHPHYVRETKYASLVTDMYTRLLIEGCDEIQMERFAKRVGELGLDVPGREDKEGGSE